MDSPSVGTCSGAGLLQGKRRSVVPVQELWRPSSAVMPPTQMFIPRDNALRPSMFEGGGPDPYSRCIFSATVEDGIPLGFFCPITASHFLARCSKALTSRRTLSISPEDSNRPQALRPRTPQKERSCQAPPPTHPPTHPSTSLAIWVVGIARRLRASSFRVALLL